jgi:hypothetical protein
VTMSEETVFVGSIFDSFISLQDNYFENHSGKKSSSQQKTRTCSRRYEDQVSQRPTEDSGSLSSDRTGKVLDYFVTLY